MISLSRPMIGVEERAAVDRVLASGHLASGPEVDRFEAEFAAAHEVHAAVAVGSGTAALHLGLWALGMGPGDEVIVPSFTFAATANSVRMCGATPVFADIDPSTFCLSAETVEPLVTARTSAVIQVHLYGQPAAIDDLTVLCERTGLALLEDAAQAHGARWRGRPVGGLGLLGAFSFYPTKNMTTGEGGMITTNQSDLADRMRLLRNHGMRRRYHHEIVGTNARMTDIAAAIGRVQLRRLPEWNRQRIKNALFYDEHLRAVIPTPVVAPGATHVYHQYTIRSSDRGTLIRSLEDAGVGYGIYYDPPCHRQQAFGDGSIPLPNTDRASLEVLSIPVRPDLTAEELSVVANAVRRGTSL